MVISAALYAGAEAYVDAAAVKSETLAVSVNANTTNKDTTKIVDQVLNKNEVTLRRRLAERVRTYIWRKPCLIATRALPNMPS